MLHSIIFFFGMLLLIILSSVDLIINSAIFILFLIISIPLKLNFFSIIRKIKYFIFALLVIYSLSTPGKILFYYSFISVTQEGFYLGVNNSLRIINTFLIIMLLMKFIPKKFFINFIIKICYPLKYFGLNIDNLTSRIFLTFDYLDYYKNYSFKFSSFTQVIDKHLKNKSFIIKAKSFSRVSPSRIDYYLIVAFFSTFILIQFL
ncbi:MAG: hypothetical protein ACI8WO_000146 [Methylophilaceae bacterium]|jgi:hypothetical protein